MRSDKEDRRNGKGYFDPTAYLAIRSMAKEERMKEYKAGDIVEIETQYTTKEAVIVAAHGTYATVLQLNENEPRENAFEIRSRQIMWADTGKVGYCFEDKIIGLVRTLSSDELSMMMAALAETLGIAAETNSEPDTQAGQTVVYDGAHANEELLERIHKAEAECYRAEVQAEVYRGMYSDLLERILGER